MSRTIADTYKRRTNFVLCISFNGPGSASRQNWLFVAGDIFQDGARWVWNKYNTTENAIMEFGFSVYKESDIRTR